MPEHDLPYQELSHKLARILRREAIPGAAFAITNAHGTLWQAGFGVCDRRHRRPVTPDTRFSLQSCTKTFTAAAVLLAVQQGLLELDRPIIEYLPDFSLQSRFEAQPQRSITLCGLLAHKAGLTHEAPLGGNYTASHEIVAFEDHIHSLQRTWLRYPVGQRYAYSNLGVDLAGYILQRVSGLPFAEFVRQNLFLPLGMHRSAFDNETVLADRERALGHDAFVEATGKALPERIPMAPSGGMFSSASDVARFLRFLLNHGQLDGKTVLNHSLVEEMLRIPFALEGQFEGYALGVAVSRQDEARLCNHDGGGFGFLCSMQWRPDDGLGAILLTNSANHAIAWDFTRRALDRCLPTAGGDDPTGARPAQPPQPAQPPHLPDLAQPDPARRVYAGHYIGRLPDHLHVQPTRAGLVLRSGNRRISRQLNFYRPDQAYTQSPQRTSHWRFGLDDSARPATLTHIDSGSLYDYNNGPGDPPGANKPHWRAFCGTYLALMLGAIPDLMTIRLANGRLELVIENPARRINLRLDEYLPGLFFTSTGEAIDFTGEQPLFCGVAVRRIGFAEKAQCWLALLRGLIHLSVTRLRSRR